LDTERKGFNSQALPVPTTYKFKANQSDSTKKPHTKQSGDRPVLMEQLGSMNNADFLYQTVSWGARTAFVLVIVPHLVFSPGSGPQDTLLCTY
jgi:hypothetical protein